MTQMQTIEVPQLETERLILRSLTQQDFEDYAGIFTDPEVMLYIGEGKPVSRLDAWRQMAAMIGHWALRGYGLWAVEEKASGKLIGRVGFFNPETWPGFELGWALAREKWGKGYATEAAQRALAYGFDEMKRDEVISLIDPNNQASIKVAERLGETHKGETELFGHEVLIYGITRAEWEASPASSLR
jgi:RimJ/RimL family protein N-acetyltransferase